MTVLLRAKPAALALVLGLGLALAGAGGCGDGETETETRGASAPSPGADASRPSEAGLGGTGQPASKAARAAVAAPVLAYAEALEQGEWAAACGVLARPLREQLAGEGGCGAALARATAGVRLGEVGPVRVRGREAVALVRDPEGGKAFLVLVREGGSWAVAAPRPFPAGP